MSSTPVAGADQRARTPVFLRLADDVHLTIEAIRIWRLLAERAAVRAVRRVLARLAPPGG